MNGSEKFIKVCIVEDNNDIRESLRILINGAAGFQCRRVFSSSEEALMDPHELDTDIVLMDINLPGKSGIDCMIDLKKHLNQTQFMMFTVFDDDDNVFKALSSGASGYILKHTAPSQIIDMLSELYFGGSPMSPEIARRVVASFQKSRISKDAELLTPREMEILTLLSKGLFYKEIAANLHLGVDTVKKHLYHVYEKLHVQNKTEAINKIFHQKP